MSENVVANTPQEEPIAHSDLGCMLFCFNEASNKFKYLVPVKAVPASKSAPSTIEVTEMDSPIKQYIPDRPDVPAYEFDYNHTAAKYAAVKAKADGQTEHQFLITYGDKSGVKFKGVGFTWRDAVSTGSGLTDKLSIIVNKVEDVTDCTQIVDVASIPMGRVHPFSA